MLARQDNQVSEERNPFAVLQYNQTRMKNSDEMKKKKKNERRMTKKKSKIQATIMLFDIFNIRRTVLIRNMHHTSRQKRRVATTAAYDI